MSRNVTFSFRFAIGVAGVAMSLITLCAAQPPKNIAQFTPYTDGGSENFGSTVAISGDGQTIAVGAPDPYFQHGNGSIFIYQEGPSGWRQVGQLSPQSNVATCGLGGRSLVINLDGSVIASEDGQNCTSGGGSGSPVIDVYARPNGGWQTGQQPSAQLIGAVGGFLAMAPSGNSVSSYAFGAASSNPLYLVVYYKPTAGWTGSIKPTHIRKLGDAQYPLQPCPVGMTENLLAVGRPDDGTIRVYQRTESGLGRQIATLAASDGEPLCLALSMDNSFIVASSYDLSSHATNVYVFEAPVGLQQQTVHEIAQLKPGATAFYAYGSTLQLSGDYLLVGDSLAQTVYLFIKPKSGWQTTSQPFLTITSGDPNSVSYGYAVGIAGTTTVISDNSYDYGSGTAYVFQFQP